MIEKPKGELTKHKGDGQDLTPNNSEHLEASFIQAVDIGVVALERSDHVARPCRRDRYGDQAEDARNNTQLVECVRNGQDTKTDLCFRHEGDSGNPPKLVLWSAIGHLTVEEKL